MYCSRTNYRQTKKINFQQKNIELIGTVQRAAGTAAERNRRTLIGQGG